MTQWNPNLFRKEGLSKGYDSHYLTRLVEQGETINERNLPVVFSLAHLANLSHTLYSDLHGFNFEKDRRKTLDFHSYSCTYGCAVLDKPKYT